MQTPTHARRLLWMLVLLAALQVLYMAQQARFIQREKDDHVRLVSLRRWNETQRSNISLDQTLNATEVPAPTTISPLIPHLIHQSWKSIDRIPHRFRPWIQSWLDHHPEWTYVFWDDQDNLALFTHVFPQYLEVATHVNKIALADMARYALLYQLGGLYVDADFECLQPFDTLHNTFPVFLSSEPLAHAVLLENSDSAALCNALMASEPRHPFWLQVLNAIATKFHAERGKLSDAVSLTGPRIVKETYFGQFVVDTSISVLPPAYFYPEIAYWNQHKMRKVCHQRRHDPKVQAACDWLDRFPKGEFTDQTHAVHHWQCTWCIGDRTNDYVTLQEVVENRPNRIVRPTFTAQTIAFEPI